MGSKLRKTATVGSTTTQREYVGGIEYSKVGTGASSIEMIHTEEGYLQRSGTSYVYHYNLTDHLGNVRATLQRTTATTGTVVQKHDYFLLENQNLYLRAELIVIFTTTKRSRASVESNTIIRSLICFYGHS